MSEEIHRRSHAIHNFLQHFVTEHANFITFRRFRVVVVSEKNTQKSVN